MPSDPERLARMPVAGPARPSAERQRDADDGAREYLDRHGRWPD